jgi:hypothetical protein
MAGGGGVGPAGGPDLGGGWGRSRLGTAATAAAATASPAGPLDEATACWVTAYGFAPGDRALVLGELARCGDVRRFGSGRGGGGGGGGNGPSSSSSSSAVNWVHVQFATPLQAARARALDGTLLAGRLLVGVKPLDGGPGAADVARLVAGGGGGDRGGDGGDDGDGENGLSGLDGGELRAAAPVMPARPYRVDAGDQVRGERGGWRFRFFFFFRQP